MHGIIIARPADCASRLEFAHVFEEEAQRRITFEAVVVLQDGDDAAMTPEWTLPRLALRYAAGRDVHASLVNGHGNGTTPVLVLYDSSRVVRSTLEAPRTPADMERLMRWLATDRP